ncbi:spermatogenesis-defective protein 39 homolog isoform X2 [Hyalella azteca]|uniref:Spermatogenesis-defective protein 39 homolog isoform X2 n=1 Tax=Hyalella azteca TaxID=294128 RepID=A0A979FS52_HYAAZ|nr:spermatogenesis-defective protein 39 homolog isoform X2 [Hyalella azteca]
MASSREQEDYWGESDTAPAALDNFFDENSTVSWRGASESGDYLVDWSKRVKPTKTVPAVQGTVVSPDISSTSYVSPDVSCNLSDSILDNITTDNLSSSSISEAQPRGVGRSLGSLGEKLQDWKPPSVKKWSHAGVVERCSGCSALEQQVAQLSNQLQASFSRSHVAVPVAAAVHAMCTGQPYALHCYRSLSDKRELLAAALRASHTSTIIAVLVFCRNTLSRQLFLQELQSSAVAAQSYLGYLKQRRQYREAMELLQDLGRHEEAALLRYRQCLAITDHAKKTAALRTLTSSSLSSPALTHYKTLINDQIDLLERQKSIDEEDSKSSSNALFKEYPRASSVYDKPLLTTLYYCAMYHWTNSGSHCAPAAFRSAYRLTERQFLWAVVRGRARVKHYFLPEQLPTLLTTRTGGMLGSLSGALSAVSSSLAGAPRPSLPLDRLLDALHAASAPHAVLAAYLSLVEPRELRLRLAQHYDVRSAVVEALVALKDKAGLQRYMEQLPPGSAEYVKADAALKTGRWK